VGTQNAPACFFLSLLGVFNLVTAELFQLVPTILLSPRTQSQQHVCNLDASLSTIGIMLGINHT